MLGRIVSFQRVGLGVDEKSRRPVGIEILGRRYSATAEERDGSVAVGRSRFVIRCVITVYINVIAYRVLQNSDSTDG